MIPLSKWQTSYAPAPHGHAHCVHPISNAPVPGMHPPFPPPGACSPLALVKAPQDQSLAAAPCSRSRTKQSCWITPHLHSAAGRARAEAVLGAKRLAHPGRICPPTPVCQHLKCLGVPRSRCALLRHHLFPSCPALRGPALECSMASPSRSAVALPKPGAGNWQPPAAVRRGRRGWQQDPIGPGAIQPGRGTCAWQPSLSLSTMASPPPCQHQHKAPCGVPRQLQPRESQAGGVEWGDVIDGEV